MVDLKRIERDAYCVVVFIERSRRESVDFLKIEDGAM